MSKFKFDAEEYNALLFRLMPIYQLEYIKEKVDEIEGAFAYTPINIFDAQKIIEGGLDPHEVVRYMRK